MSFELVERFFTVAEARPNDVAVIMRNSPNETYGALAKRVRSIAGALHWAGEHPKVLICAPKGPGAYGAMLATLMVGGYYAPLDLEGPTARRRLIMDRFKPDAIITGGDLGARALEEMGGPPDGVMVFPDDPQGVPLGAPKAPHDLAYVMFTSGSTGVPKGVMVGREGLNGFIQWAINRLPLGPGARMSQYPNLGFDMSVLDIYASLCSGAALVPLTGMLDRMAPALAIQSLGITVWESVPSVVDLIRKANHATKTHLSSLQAMYFCGEALLPEQVKALFECRPDLDVINAYGPTEATISCSTQSLTRKTWKKHARTSMAIGEPTPGMSLSITGGPDADEGELVISGPQLARGYWEDVERTAQAFQADGYHTGDWVKRVNGAIYYQHRIDRQVKVKGHRLELGEVDAALRAAGCLAVRSVLSDGQIVSFIEGTLPAPEDDLRQQLRVALPEYAMPARIEAIEALPRNANDKIDDGQLSAIAEAEAAS
ncbi:MAG: AMP-binding protein [Bradymonadia bacterium]